MKKLLLAVIALFVYSVSALAAVDLNTATKEELDAVKGIGPVKAQAIVDYRRQHGSFKNVDELKNVKGFGDKTVAKMRSELTVGGAPAKADAKKEEKAEKKKTKAEKKAERKEKAEKKADKAGNKDAKGA